MNRLTDALRYSRRNSYIYGDKWDTLVVVQKYEQIRAAWEEVVCLTDASSLLIEEVKPGLNWLKTSSGSTIRVTAVGDMTDAYMLSGRHFTHIIWLYDPEEKVANYVQALLRGMADRDHLRNERADW